MTRQAVLFDWRGTLVATPGPQEWVRLALQEVGRPAGPAEVDAILAAIELANGPDDRLDGPGMDTDAALHRRLFLEVMADAGLDVALASALHALDADPRLNAFAVDALPVLQALDQRGVAVAVLSDIHFDVRPLFDGAGLVGLVELFTLSFEQGIQKPNPAMFTRTLEALDVPPERALMVGDRSRPDGAAVEQGITTLLLPPLRDVRDARLHKVLALVGGPSGLAAHPVARD